MIRFRKVADVPEEEREEGIGRRRFLLACGKGLAWLSAGLYGLGASKQVRASTEEDVLGGGGVGPNIPNPYDE